MADAQIPAATPAPKVDVIKWLKLALVLAGALVEAKVIKEGKAADAIKIGGIVVNGL